MSANFVLYVRQSMDGSPLRTKYFFARVQRINFKPFACHR
jgi:hypothetical protein